MTLAASDPYQRLAEMAEQRHQAGRTLTGVDAADIDLARLYSYAFRCHTIGAFHATRLALQAMPAAGSLAQAHRQRAIGLLEALADRAMDRISTDARALVGTFHGYDRDVRQVDDALRQEMAASAAAGLGAIAARFRTAVERITASNGIVLTRDTAAPEQASFVVPNLGITIVPLVYGDFNSWNLAWLDGQRSDVPRHQHHDGVEIHLGYSPIHGKTILGDHAAEVREGYAMPIPPGAAHGYVNASDQPHHVPFIFGSLKAGGWGVFLDVEPRPFQIEQLQTAELTSRAMNGSVHLEREIAAAAAEPAAARRVLIPAAATDRHGSGGLELAVARVPPAGWDVPRETYRIVSVVRGAGVVRIGAIEQNIDEHDHFGIPGGMSAALRQVGPRPLVVLDAVLRAACS